MATIDLAKNSGPPSDPGGNSVGVVFDTTANQLRLNNGGTYYNFAPTSTGPAATTPATSSTATLGVPQYVTVTIPTASVAAIRATPYELVPAPGAGRINLLLGGTVILIWNSVAYTETSDNLAVRYTDGSGGLASGTIEATGLADAVASTMSTILPAGLVVATSAAANKALVLHNTGDGEWGNSGNSGLVVKVTYMVVAST